MNVLESIPICNGIIFDIRHKGYEVGHLPGAISAPYSNFRGPQSNPGQLLAEQTLKEL